MKRRVIGTQLQSFVLPVNVTEMCMLRIARPLALGIIHPALYSANA